MLRATGWTPCLGVTMMRALTYACALAAVVAAIPANGQTFVFEAKANTPTNVGTMGPDGVPIAGAYWTGSTTTTWTDGKKTNENYACVSTTQPPNAAIFHMHAICDATSPAGNYTSVWGCNFRDKERTLMGCVGGLYGKTGMFAGKGGGINYMGMVGGGSGTGQWTK